MNDADLYREQGYVHARAVFEAREVDELRVVIDRILDGVAGTEHDENHVWKGGRAGGRAQGLPQRAIPRRSFTRAATHPRLVELLMRLIGPNVQLHHTKMLVKPPERGAPFPMHQDYAYFPHEPATRCRPRASTSTTRTSTTAACASSPARTGADRSRCRARATRSPFRPRKGRRCLLLPATSSSSTT